MIVGLGLQKNKNSNQSDEKCCKEIKDMLYGLPDVDPYHTFLINYNS